MPTLMQILIGLLFITIPLILGWIIGGTRERQHLRQLQSREEQFRSSVIVTQSKVLLSPNSKLVPCLLTAEVVIATDYLKSYLTSWRSFFGGEVRSYRTILERARREATMRMVEEAHRSGYNAVANVRLETADLGGASSGRKGAAMAAIVATATAYVSDITVREDDGPLS